MNHLRRTLAISACIASTPLFAQAQTPAPAAWQFGYLPMTVYAFWALTLALTLLTLLVFQRQRRSQKSGVNKGAWFVIGLAVVLQAAALSLGGRLVSLVFHVISLITVCAGLLTFGVYASIILVTGRSRKHDVGG